MPDMLIRNVAWAFSAQVVRLLTALFLVAVLDPAARGLQSLLVLLPTLVGSLTLLGVGSATPVILHRGVDDRRLLANLLGLGLSVIAFVTVVLLPCLPLAAHFLSDPQRYMVSSADVLLGFLLLPPTLLGDYLRSLLTARNDLRQVAITQSVQAVTQLVLAVVLVLGLQSGPLGAVWGAVIGAWCGFVWTLRVVSPIGSLRPRLDHDVLRPLLGLGLRGHLGNIVQTFNYRLDALLVQGFQGQAAVGLYQTGVMLAEMVWYLPNAVGAALLPQIAATGETRTTAGAARHTLLLTTVGALALAGIAWPGFAFFRPAYLPTVAPMIVLLIGVVALSIHKVLASDLSGRGLPQYPTITSTVALCCTIGGDLLLIPRWGILGAAWTSTVAYFVQTLLLLLFYMRVTDVPLRVLLVPQRSDLVVYRRLALSWRGETMR